MCRNLVPFFWQTYQCVSHPFSFAQVKHQELDAPQQEIYLHNSWKIYLIWTVIWQECCCLCQLFKNYLLSLSLILLSPSLAFWKSFLNFHHQQLLSVRAVTSDLPVLFFLAVISNISCYPRNLHRSEWFEEKKQSYLFFIISEEPRTSKLFLR